MSERILDYPDGTELSAADLLELRTRRGTGGFSITGWELLGWCNLSDVRDAARWYARTGLHPIALHGVMPGAICTCSKGRDCESAGKHPVETGWQKAPLDGNRLDRLLAENPWWNVGLRMGLQPSGLFLIAIDIDGPRDLLAPLEAENGPLPATLTATTGSGGSHLLFTMPSDRAPRNRVRLAEGIDVRSAGGQIVAAPSRHVSGGRYRWTEVRNPEALPL